MSFRSEARNLLFRLCPPRFACGRTFQPSTFDFRLLTPFTMNTYRKRACNPPEMNTYKIIGLKPPLESTLTKKGGGGIPRHPVGGMYIAESPVGTKQRSPARKRWEITLRDSKALEGRHRPLDQHGMSPLPRRRPALTASGPAGILDCDTYSHAPHLP